MLTTDEFQHWCAHLQLSTEAQELIATIRSSLPVRKVRGRLGAVAGRYPSPKMGRTIQFASQRVELWAIYAMEWTWPHDTCHPWEEISPLRWQSKSFIHRLRNVGLTRRSFHRARRDRENEPGF